VTPFDPIRPAASEPNGLEAVLAGLLASSSSATSHQHTIATPAQCTGVGVHSGKQVTLRLLPGEADTGIIFIRTDLQGEARSIPARWDTVADTRLCTVIANEHGGKVGTIEHLMAALHASGVDNAVVEIDGPEVPIMDGSSAPFMLLIEMAGMAAQKAPRRTIEILKPVEVTMDGKRAALLPSDETRYTVEIAFDKSSVIQRQTYDFELTTGGFKSEISRARTFGFLEEVEYLRKNGLALGGSLHNAVVISGDKILNEDGLRYNDEFVRHKLLDAVGDLALAGAPIRGHFQGTACGHAINNQLLRALFADATAWRYISTSADTEDAALEAVA
jgi:UDP-3-O-[3-hydroxymyristoyl] N-acetylglucosamine deacetylase